MSRYFMGVDAGATRTRAIVADEALKELGRAEGPPAAVDPRFPERAADTIADLVGEAADRAGVPLPCAALWVGAAGAGRETTRSGVEMVLARQGLADRVRVGTDVEAAFHEAHGEGPGIILVSGTGSVAQGRGENGRIGRVGGWGSLIGDEGSGYAIGLEGLRRVARDEDGRGPETELRAAVLTALGLADVQELVAWAASATKADVASLVPVVAESARDGDAVAGEILVQAVEELDGHVETLLDNLGPWSSRPRVALTGGLLHPGGPLRRGMEAALRRHNVGILGRVLYPALGAVQLARAMADEAEVSED